MNVGLFVGHPAHYHYLKFVAKNLAERGHNVHFVVKKKDILEDLMKEAGLDYTLIRENRGDSKLSLINSVLQMERKGLNQIREEYLKFFESKGHLKMKSFSRGNEKPEVSEPGSTDTAPLGNSAGISGK